MIGLDTNVLVRYLTHDDEAQFTAAAELVATLTPECPGFVTQVTMAELWWVLGQTYGFSKDARVDVVRTLISSDALEFDDGEGVVRALELTEQGADFPDALIQGAMELFGVTETVTLDRKAANRLGWRLLTT